MAGQTIQISVLADTQKFSAGMKKAADELGGLGKVMGGVGKLLAAGLVAAGVGAAALIGIGVKQAAELEQSIGAIDTVFKGASGQMHSWAQNAAQDVGLTRNEFNELGTLIGTQLKNGGTAMDQLAPKTNSLIGLGADLSSMFGGSTKEAVEALSSALKGERDPIEKYGVSLNQAKIDAEAAALGFKKVGNSFSSEAQQAATLSLIMKQTSDAHGNFAKESETLAGKQQRLTAEFTNFTTNIGMALLPMITQLVGVLADNAKPAFDAITTAVTTQLVPALQGFGEWMTGTGIPSIQGFFGFMNDNKDVIGVIAAAIGGAALAFGVWQGALAAWTIIQNIATAAQVLFNLVLSANPIMLVVIAIAALVAGLVYFFTQTEVGRKAWATFTAFLKSAWDATVKFFNDTLNNVKKWFADAGTAVQRSWEAVQTFFSQLPAKIKAFFASAAQWLTDRGREILDGLKRGAENAWGTVVSFFTAIPGKIQGALSGAASWLVSTGSAIIQGLWNGISSKVDWVVGMVRGLGSQVISAAKSIFGVASPSKVFAEIGGYLSEGLAKGIGNEADLAAKAAAGLGSLTTGAFDASFDSTMTAPRGTVYVFNGIEVSNGRIEDALAVLADEITHYAGVGV